jgi:hypothetical protein
MDAIKFPINSYESYFIAMVSGVAAYLIGSWITYKEPYNMDRLLHRGEYSIDGIKHIKTPWTMRNFVSKIIGITPDYTRGDRMIAWSVFTYAIIYKMGFCFLFVLIWNLISPWPEEWWSHYFFYTSIVASVILASVSSVWFSIGGGKDTRRLFKDLSQRVDNPLDDGSVVGHVSLADKAVFEAKTHKPEDD